MSPLLLALGASLAWGVADFVGPLISRTLGTLRVLFWAQVGGVVAIAIAVAIRGDGPASWEVLFAVAAAFGGHARAVRVLPRHAARRDERVAPIAGASAVIPVIFGIATGDSPSASQVAGIVCALVGVALASIEHHEGTRRIAAGVGLALLAAVGFGFYFPWMHAAGKVDFWWASLIFRTTALLLVTAAVAAQQPVLRLRRRELAIALRGRASATRSATCSSLRPRATASSSLTSVLASLYPIVTVLLAAAVLHERVARTQKAGIVLTLTGVVLISV